MKTIKQSYEMAATPEEVFDAFVNPELAAAWSGSEAIVSAEEGFEWSLWDGSIIGKNLQMIPGQSIVQDWKEVQWETPSKVTFTLTPVANGTKVDLLHEMVPDQSAKSIANGWKVYYLGPMQELFAQ